MKISILIPSIRPAVRRTRTASRNKIMKLSVIIPAYNEAATLPKIIKAVQDVQIPQTKEIIVVNDGSTDNTQEVLKKLKNIKVIENAKNLGKGTSIIKALKVATGDLVLIQDADLEYNPKEYPKLLVPFGNKNVKVVYGSRVLGKNPISHWTFNLGGRLITKITNLLYNTNITDEPTGYKVFRREILDSFKLKSKGFEFCPEVTAKVAKKNIKITEVPISYNPRPMDQKKIKWHDGLLAIFFLVKYRLMD